MMKFIENVKLQVNDPDVAIKAGYEAGCLVYSLYWQLEEKGIDCDILAPSTMQRSAKNKVVKNDRRDAKNIACICKEENGKLIDINETHNIENSGNKVICGDWELDKADLISMNMCGL